MKELAMATLIAGGVCTADATSASLPLTQEWDKVFPKSNKVEHAKVTFKNRFGITLAADVYKPKMGNGEWGTGNDRYPPAEGCPRSGCPRYNGNNSFSSRTRLAERDCSLTTERLG